MVSPVMEVESECVVTGALATVLRWTRYVGLSPLWLRREGNGWRAEKSHRAARIAKILAATACCVMIGTLVTSMRVPDRIVMSVKEVVLAVGTISTMATAMIMVWTASGRMTCLVASLNSIKQIHCSLHTQPDQMTKMQSGFLLTWMAANFMIYFIKHLHTTVTSFPLLFQSGLTICFFPLFYFAFEAVQVLGVVQFMLLAREVRSGFKAVNETLKKLLKTDFIDSKCTLSCVRDTSVAYDSACDVVRAMDAAHGLMLMAVITVCFLNLTITPYICIQIIVSEDSEQGFMFYIFVAMHIMFCCVQLGNLMLVVEPCHSTQAEMELTSKLVSQLMCRAASVHDPLAVELAQFCRNITLNRASYSPLNLITINRELVIAILVSITTYLVIIVDIK